MDSRFHKSPAGVNGKTCRLLTRRLLRWYGRHQRNLPWRRSRDPYHIWVSEIMLQQTRVEVVRPYFERWVKHLPTIQALAHSPESQVLKLWEGLGYYQRARNLRRAARILVRDHGGKLPPDLEQLRQLPGLGRYTAGAVASIAFGAPTPVVDGNVARVLARMFGLRAPIEESAAQKRLWSLAAALVPAGRPGDFNQALMELGALVCTPARPRCSACPWRGGCRAHGRGWEERLPRRRAPRSATQQTVNVVLVRRGGRILLQRRARGRLLTGLWQLPRLTRHRFRADRSLLELRHTITHRRITLRLHRAVLLDTVPRSGNWRWLSRAELRRVAMPAAHRRALAALGST